MLQASRTMVGQKVLMKGTEAIAKAAIAAGCQNYFGYPITPQNEVAEYLSRALPQTGGVFIQAESETTAINMVFGAAAVGQRVLTTTSSTGYSLMMEGISNLAGSNMPAVLVLVMRLGPGAGGIDTSQLDYTSTTKGGAHGGYHTLVLAPWSCQELHDLTHLSFHLADKYCHPVIVLADGTLAQMMEPVEAAIIPPYGPLPEKAWALDGTMGKRPKNIISSTLMTVERTEAFHREAQAKYAQMADEELRYEAREVEDADILVVAFGAVARVAWTATQQMRQEGLRVGLFRPITLYPFPYNQVEAAAAGKRVLVVEGNMGQMLEDVRMAVGRRANIGFVGQPGGLMSPAKVVDGIRRLVEV